MRLSGIGRNGIYNIGGTLDALEAVKLDPAVLEARVNLDTRQSPNELNKIQEIFQKTKEVTSSPCCKEFKNMMSQHETALLSLSPDKLHLLMMYVDFLRKQRMSKRKYVECAFCKNNGKSLCWYTSHTLKDRRGRVLCPVLRAFRCPRCGATGDRAHTIKYCPEPAETDKGRRSCRKTS